MKVELELYLSSKYRAIVIEGITKDTARIRILKKDGTMEAIGNVSKKELKNASKLL